MWLSKAARTIHVSGNEKKTIFSTSGINFASMGRIKEHNEIGERVGFDSW